MKLSNSQLKRIIKEELSSVLSETEVDSAAQELSAQWQGGQNFEGSGGWLDTLKFFLRMLKEFDPAEARRRTKGSTAMGDFVLNDFDGSGIPVEQHPALAKKILASFSKTQAAPEDIAINIDEPYPGATIQDEELDQEIKISLTDNSGQDHLVTITLRQLVRAARGA